MERSTGETSDSRERFLEALCARRQQFVVVFAFALVFLLVQVPYLFVSDGDSALYVVAWLNVVGSTVFALGSGGVLWVCTRRD